MDGRGAVIFLFDGGGCTGIKRRDQYRPSDVIQKHVRLVVISLILFATKQTALIHSPRIGLHCVRNGFHFMGQYGWLVGITVLPLAEVFALEFTVPLWTALIAWLCLGETLTLRKLSAILLGLLGVMVIVKPGMAVFNLSSFIVLGAACCYAISHTSTKSLAVTESPLTILFYMSLVQLPLGLLLTLNHWTAPTLQQGGWLFIIGATALTAHFCMTKAMQHAEVSIVVILDFMRLPAIGMVGAVLYGESSHRRYLLVRSSCLSAIFSRCGNRKPPLRHLNLER